MKVFLYTVPKKDKTGVWGTVITEDGIVLLELDFPDTDEAKKNMINHDFPKHDMRWVEPNSVNNHEGIKEAIYNNLFVNTQAITIA